MLFIYMTTEFRGPENKHFKNRFRSAFFEKNTIIVSVYRTKTQMCENSDVIRLCITHADYRNVYCMCAVTQCFSQNDSTIYWSGMNNTAFSHVSRDCQQNFVVCM